MISTELKNYFAKIRVLGQGADRVSISISELAWVLCLAANDLGLELANAPLKQYMAGIPQFYTAGMPPALPKELEQLTTNALLEELDHLIQLEPDVRLYVKNLCSILKRRIKYQRILSAQPKPTMDQVIGMSLRDET